MLIRRRLVDIEDANGPRDRASTTDDCFVPKLLLRFLTHNDVEINENEQLAR